MSKLFKKSLAFCVAIAMVFTLFAGTISVNAEDAEETLTVTLEVTNTTVEDGAAQVTFPLAVTCSGDTSINVLRLVITTTAGKVSNVVSAAETDDYTISYNGDRALLNAGTEVDSLGGFTTANLLVTVDLNEGLDKEAYDITIDARSENASDANENALKISYETGYIRLLAHTHELSETYTYDANGHWQVCTSDYCEVEGGYTTEVAAHVWENDGDPVYTDCVSNGTQAQICLCGATQTITVDPKGHNFVDGKCECGETESTPCEHEWEFVTATPAEGTSTGKGFDKQTTTKVGSISLVCSKCEEKTTKEVNYYGRTKVFTANAVYQSSIQLEYAARKDRLIDAGQYGDAFVRFSHVLSDGTLKETAQKVADGKGAVKNDRDSLTWFYSVKPMQLTEVIDTNVFFEIDGAWYSGESYGYSVRSYADEILPLAKVTTTEKTLVVNMLRYGAKMQILKGYNLENLADADLPAEYAALIKETDPTIAGTPTKDETIGNDCVQILTSFQLFMDSRTEVKFRVRSDRYTAEPKKDDFIIVCSWETARGGETKTARFYNVATASEGELTYGQDTQSSNQGRWEFRFGECSAYDFRQVITFNIYDPDDLTTDISQKYSASFENLIRFALDSGAIKDQNEIVMYNAMMNYSDAARAHFCQ